MTTSRQTCERLDRDDPLAGLRELFDLPAGVIYLDGNSLGALPSDAAARVRRVVEDEWGRGLIRSWNSAGWIDMPQRVGDKIARLVGAGAGELVVADATSVNLFKALSAALGLMRVAAPERNVILTERNNFPTDLYIAEIHRPRARSGVAARRYRRNPAQLDGDGGGALAYARQLSRWPHARDGRDQSRRARRGALVVWDLSHSAGAVPVDLNGNGNSDDAADFAVGCGYKYLNGGPGAPAFVWAHPRHTATMDALQLGQPLAGWLGHAAPFDFAPNYRPADGIACFLCGTPPVVSLAALECGVDTLLAAESLGGIAALRVKSLALTELFISLVDARCADRGLVLRTPREQRMRGSQVSYARADGAYAIMQALIARGVIGDFRAPDILRFGVTPLYTRFTDIWDAVENLGQVLDNDEWRDARFRQRAAVT